LDGRARLDLLPEGTILRLGPETRFTLSILGEDPNDPFASLLLEAGRLWVILTGGSLNVETGLGIASVRGSFLGVSFDPGMQQMVATCLEGICSLWNEAGTVNLRTGQAAEITGTGQPPSPVRPYTDDEVTEWRENNPEAVDIELPVYPSPTPSPLGWTITNNCEESYQFVFTGVETLELIVEAGQTITGELPRGKYLLAHTPVDDGYASESEIKEEANDFSITICSSE
jgi:hypothetical protein